MVRASFGRYSIIEDLEARTAVAKANLLQATRNVTREIENDPMPNAFVCLLFAERSNFVRGDGLFESFSHSCVSGQIRGEAIVPLTPDLSVFLCFSSGIRPRKNVASLVIPKNLTDDLNELIRVYSKDKVFFRGSIPEVCSAFASAEFQCYTEAPWIIEELREVARHAGQRKIEGLKGIRS
jgi:hypothetical protein